MNPEPNIIFKLPLVEVGGTGTLAVIAATLVVLVLIAGVTFLLYRRAALIAKVARSIVIGIRQWRMRKIENDAPSIVPPAAIEVSEVKRVEGKSVGVTAVAPRPGTL